MLNFLPNSYFIFFQKKKNFQNKLNSLAVYMKQLGTFIITIEKYWKYTHIWFFYNYLKFKYQ